MTDSVNTKSDPSASRPLAEGGSASMPGIYEETLVSEPIEGEVLDNSIEDDENGRSDPSVNARSDPSAESLAESANKDVGCDNAARSATTVALSSRLEEDSVANSSKKISLRKKILLRVVVAIFCAGFACAAVFAINYVFFGEESANDSNQVQSAGEKGFNETKSDPSESEDPEEDTDSENSDSSNPEADVKVDGAATGSSEFGTFSHGSSEDENNSNGQAITVNVSVYGHGVSGGGTFTFEPGATVYDALMACGLSVNAKNTVYGIYVAAIGGVAEKQYGDKSGWLYAVNGVTPNIACSGYVLENGDNVSWFYTDGN